jgi:hypothetical protein
MGQIDLKNMQKRSGLVTENRPARKKGYIM